MKVLSLLLWVTQFGLSCLFPLCLFLYLAAWLQNKYNLGIWIFLVLGIIGFLTSISTARSCWRSMQKEAERISDKKTPPVAFNDHS